MSMQLRPILLLLENDHLALRARPVFERMRRDRQILLLSGLVNRGNLDAMPADVR